MFYSNIVNPFAVTVNYKMIILKEKSPGQCDKQYALSDLPGLSLPLNFDTKQAAEITPRAGNRFPSLNPLIHVLI